MFETKKEALLEVAELHEVILTTGNETLIKQSTDLYSELTMADTTPEFKKVYENFLKLSNQTALHLKRLAIDLEKSFGEKGSIDGNTKNQGDEDEILKHKRVVAAEYRKRNRARLNAYKREWAKNNPEKVKAARDRYYLRKAQKIQESGGNT